MGIVGRTRKLKMNRVCREVANGNLVDAPDRLTIIFGTERFWRPRRGCMHSPHVPFALDVDARS